jgi:hypothetical protein
MKNIFVEGPDGSGKSHLVQRLQNDLERPAILTGGPPKNAGQMRTRFNWVKALCQDHNGLIFDRAPMICEIVYPALVGRLNYFSRKECVDELIATNPIVVYCRRPLADMRESISQSPKGHKSSEHLRQVLDSYPDLVNRYHVVMDRLEAIGVPVIRYDFERDSYQELLDCLAYYYEGPF